MTSVGRCKPWGQIGRSVQACTSLISPISFTDIGPAEISLSVLSDNTGDLNVVYYYRVRAYKRSDVSDPSNVASATTQGGTTLPTTPSGLSAVAAAV